MYAMREEIICPRAFKSEKINHAQKNTFKEPESNKTPFEFMYPPQIHDNLHKHPSVSRKTAVLPFSTQLVTHVPYSAKTGSPSFTHSLTNRQHIILL